MSNDHDFSPSLPYPPKPSSSIPDIDCVQDTGWRPTGHQKAAEFPRSRTANKGVVLSCRGIRNPPGLPKQDCEQGGCFILPGYQKAAVPPEAGLRTRGLFYPPGYQEAAVPPGAGLRTRGLFCPAGGSESRRAPRSRTANKGVVLSCRDIRKPLVYPEQDCEQGGCFVLPGYQESAEPPVA